MVTAVAVLLARVAFARLVNKTDLPLRRFAAHVFLAAIDAPEYCPPLEVHQRDKHHRETQANGDVEGPAHHLLFLLSIGEALVLELEGCFAVCALLTGVGHAACDDPDLVCTLELVVTVLRNDFLYRLWLCFPKVRVERADYVDFTVSRHFFDCDLKLYRQHRRPFVGLARILSLDVLHLCHAGALRIIDDQCI